MLNKIETFKNKQGQDHYEILPCGHMNNLLIKDKLTGKLLRTRGICPKGCKIDWNVK